MGDQVLDQNGVKQLASLPSLDQLRGKIIGLIQAPGDQDRWNRGCAGWSARSRHWRLRQQGRCLRPAA